VVDGSPGVGAELARLAGDTSRWQTIVLPTTLEVFERAAIRT
jgi:hypothetical protein